MKKSFMLISIILAVLLQSLLMGWAAMGDVRPPVVLSLVLYFALRCKKSDMWLAAFFAGILSDSMEPGPFGVGLLSFPIIASLVHRVQNELFTDGLITQVFLGAMGSLLLTMLTMLIYNFSDVRPVSIWLGFFRLGGSFILGAVTMPVVCLMAKFAESSIPRRREIRWR